MQFDVNIYALQLYLWEGAGVADHIDVAPFTATMGSSIPEAGLGEFLRMKACPFMLHLRLNFSDPECTIGYAAMSESLNS